MVEKMTADPTHKYASASDIDRFVDQPHGNAPWKEGQEWANALTHGLAAAATLFIGGGMIAAASSRSDGLAIACGAYVASVFGTFLFSTLSHLVRRQPLLDTMRSWDQAMIYTMISGTYTPIVFRFAPEETRVALLTAIWVAAAIGFLGKVALRHRVNSIGSISYLMLGWLPALPLIGHVPTALSWDMLAGGVVYTIGVLVLMNDGKAKYLHAVWHICVVSAATVHYLGIMAYVVRA
jgi:hemolysin III